MEKQYVWLPLQVVLKYEPEMQRLGVSKVARSRRGFLTAYKRASGDKRKMSDYWVKQRTGFIARFLAVWDKYPTDRVKLALIAWAYMPR